MDSRIINLNKQVNSSTIFRPIRAIGGVESTITHNGIVYKLHVFTTVGSDTFSILDSGSDGLTEVLVVGGGGGGGMDMGGGGGGGGVIYTRYKVNPGENIPVTVGAGGFGGPQGSGGYRTDGSGPQPSNHQFTISATNGGNSIFGTLTASGGGYGGSSYFGYTPNLGIGAAGGSGGGTSGYSDGSVKAGQAGTPGQGYRGGQGGGQYYSGGGGGAGGIGTDSTAQPNGGPGRMVPILGFDLYWGGGGGGSSYSLGTGGNGGIGGGGGGALGTTTGGAGYNNGQAGYGGSPGSQTNTRGGAGGANTGGGGGGGSHYNATNLGGEGGSGIVVVRYPLERPLPSEPSIVKSNLICNIDMSSTYCYPGAGDRVYDISGNGNSLILFNSPTFSNETFTFNGTNQYARTIDTLNLSSYSSVTVEIDLRIINANVGMAFEHTADWNTNTGGFGLYPYSEGGAYVLNRHHTNHNSVGVLNYSATVGSGWATHTNIFSRVSDSSGRQTYVNGSLVATQATSAGSFANAHLFIASRGGTSAWGNHQVGAIRIYGRKLTQEEVLQNFNANRSRYGI